LALTLADFGLSENPFLDISTLNPYSYDVRENGKVFVEGDNASNLQKVLSRINFGESVTYVGSTATTKGVGKSALMAALYWKLAEQKRPAIWTTAVGSYSIGSTVSRIFDAAISRGFASQVAKALGDVTHEKLHKIIVEYYSPSPSNAIIDGLYKVMSVSEWEMPAKLANIKRSLISYGPSEVFSYFLAILISIKIPKLIIFLDQFEDYVQAHLGVQAVQRLSDDWRILLESFRGKASLIATVHPEAEQKIRQLTNYRLAPITDDSRVIVRGLPPQAGIELAMKYISEFRIKGYEGDPLNPFKREAVEFLARNANGNPRALIWGLRTSMRISAERDNKLIDLSFLKSSAMQGALLPTPKG
jgi:hypothetical protein